MLTELTAPAYKINTFGLGTRWVLIYNYWGGGDLEIFFTILCVCFTWLEMSEGLFKKQKNDLSLVQYSKFVNASMSIKAL